MPTSSLKFPDRFFEVHKERMAEAARKYSSGTIFSFILKENWDHSFGDGYFYVVNVKIVQTERGTHMVPASANEVKIAEQWEQRYKGVPDDELTA